MDIIAYILLGIVAISPWHQVQQWERRLNSDNFQRREQTEKELRKIKSLYILRSLAYSKIPEVRLRARPIYRHYQEEVLKTLEPIPDIDYNQWYDQATCSFICKSALGRYYMKRVVPIGTWPQYGDYKLATILMVMDLMDYGIPVYPIRILLHKMKYKDPHSKK